MIAESIDFLLSLRRGVSSITSFESIFAEAQRGVDEQVRMVATQLAAKQQDVESKVQALCARVAAVDAMAGEQQLIESVQNEVRQLSEANKELQDVVKDKKEELEARVQHIKEVTGKLAVLSAQAKIVPGPYDQFFVEYGRRVVDQMIGVNNGRSSSDVYTGSSC